MREEGLEGLRRMVKQFNERESKLNKSSPIKELTYTSAQVASLAAKVRKSNASFSRATNDHTGAVKTARKQPVSALVSQAIGCIRADLIQVQKESKSLIRQGQKAEESGKKLHMDYLLS